jgi:multidrug efflux pump subunit AcrA (membrane-fusion protein)
MKKIFSLNFIKKHKVFYGMSLIIFIVVGYYTYGKINNKEGEIKYTIAMVQKGSIVSTISGSGQVAVLNQIDIKPKVSGDIAEINLVVGQEVKKGDLIAKIDDNNAKKAVRDAEVALETANIDLSKLISPAEELDFFRAENDLLTAKTKLETLINPNEETLYQAETVLISSQDSLLKLKNSQTTAYSNALESKQNYEDELEKIYEDSFNAISDIFLEIPTTIIDLRDVLYSEEISKSDITAGNLSWNKSALLNNINGFDSDDRDKLQVFIASAENDYKLTRERFDANLINYKSANRYSEKIIIENLANETLETLRAMSDTIKSEINMLDFWVDYRSQRGFKIFTQAASYQTDLKSYTSKINSNLSNTLSIKTKIDDGKKSIVTAQENIDKLKQEQPLDLASSERTVKEKKNALEKLKKPEQSDINAAQILVKEKELALEDLKAGADSLDIRTKRNIVAQKQDALSQAKEDVLNHNIYAPYDAFVAAADVKKGDSVSSGSSLATLITKQKIAVITLNEIDVSKLKKGQKAIVKLDSIESFEITGEVAEIDVIGKVSQGVVTYDAKIIFDAQDERIKPGMSISVSIIIDKKLDVLVVANSAVKTSGGNQYVEMPNEEINSTLSENKSGIVLKSSLKQIQIQTGLFDDTNTEIISGLNERDVIITKKINPTTAATANQTQTQQGQSLFQVPGSGGGGANRFRNMQ